MKLDLANCVPVNYLWSDLLKRLGIEKAKQAIRQALDLQSMRGTKETLPILFTQTGGVAFTTYKFLQRKTGLNLSGENKVLLYSSTKNTFQLLHEVKKIY